MKIHLGLLALLFSSLSVFSQTITVSGPTAFCDGGSVLLTAPAGTAYQWQKNGADIPAATTSTYTAITSGSYVVMVTIAGVPTPTPPVDVVVNPNPIPTFTFANTVCGETPIQFTGSATGGTPPYTYIWHFGDGGTASIANPIHSFISLGCGTAVFQDTLIVIDANGCQGRIIHPITILQSPDVQLQDQDLFSPFSNCDNSPTPANPNFTLKVNNISPSAGCITSYTINWGDGNVQPGLTSISFPLTHTYTQLGAFNLTITANGVNGCIHSKTYVVANQSNPAGGLSTLGGTTGLCAPATVRFVIDAWFLNSPGTVYRMDFGDNTSILLPHPLNTTFLPDTISHVYNKSSCPLTSYTAKLTVINACDSTTYTASNIQIRKGPQANFSLPVVACAGQNTCFVDSTIRGDYGSNCASTTTYSWDFGDPGSPGNVTNTDIASCHIYTTPGVYSVTLTTSNPCGTSTITKQVCVTAAPVASFTISATAVCVGTVVNAANTSIPSTCAATNYVWSVGYISGFCGTSAGWSFANGTTATSVNPSFVFTNPGTYTIILTINSPCGTTTSQKVVKVKKPPTVSLPVVADACGQVTVCPAPTIVNCGESALTYAWLFDGVPAGNASSANPGCIPFTATGTHTISLTVSNECGPTTVSRQFTINPVPAITVPAPASLCTGENTGNFIFTSTTPGAVITWTNNNTTIGLVANGAGSINSFTAVNNTALPVTATITVTATANGCPVQSTFTITVNPKPQPPVVTTPVRYCKDETAVPLTATGSVGNSLLWYATATGGAGTTVAPIPLTNAIGVTNYYVSQVNTLTGCESNRSLIVVNVSLIPSIAGGSAANPLACSTATGTITLTGLTASAAYTVQYTFNGNPVTVSISSDAAGTLVITGLAAGIYADIHVSLGGCFSNTAGPFTLTDPNPPALPVAGSNSPICEQQSLNLTASTATAGVNYIWTGPNGFNSNLQNPVINPVTVTASGTYHVTAVLNNCHSAPASVDVLIYPTPVRPVVGGSVIVCTGDDINLQSSSNFPGAATYTWSGPDGFTSNVPNPVIPGAVAAMSGVYSVTVTATLGNCQSPAGTVNVIVNPRPVIGGSSFVNPSACGTATGSITLTGLTPSASFVVKYIKDGGTPVTTTIIANGSGNVVINGLTAGVYSNISVTLTGCISGIVGPFTLTDPNPPAAPAASSNGPICQGESLQLTSSSAPGATYAWTGPNSFSSTTQNPVINPATLAATGTYNVIATLNNCHSLPASVNVLINPRPAIPIVPATITVCTGDTIKLLSSSGFAGPLTYAWSGPNGFTSNLQNPVIPNASAAMNGSYSLAVTSVQGSCQSAPAATTVSVLPLPHISNSSHINPIGCGTATGSIILSGLVPSRSYTVHYSHNAGPITTVTAVANNAGSIIISGLTAGVYTNVTVSFSGCSSNTAGPFMLKDTAPFSVLAESNGPLCEQSNLLLSAEVTTTGGATYEWNGPNGFTSNIQSPVIPDAGVINNGFYYVAVTIDGCTSTDSITVTVSQHSIGGNTGPDAVACYGRNSGAINLSGNLGQVIRWEASINNGLSWAPISSTSFILPYNDLTITTWYRAVIKNGACPFTYAGITKITVVNSVRSVSFAPENLSTCKHDTVILFTATPVYSGSDPLSYYWYINGQVQGTTNPFSWPVHVPLNSTTTSESTVRVLAENSVGCGDTSTIGKLIIYPIPAIKITKSNDINCVVGTSKLHVSGADQYYWWSKDSSFSNPASADITVRPTVTTTYHVTATSSDGCVATDSITVTVNKNSGDGSFEIPNAFTPNGDGKNDCIGVQAWGLVSDFEFSVYDRWGQRLFYTKNPSECWDGTTAGKRQPLGVYVYWIKAKTICEDHAFRKGTIVLIR